MNHSTDYWSITREFRLFDAVMGMEETMKYITIQIPVSLASKLVDAIQVGAEGLDDADYHQLIKLSNEISEALDNIGWIFLGHGVNPTP